MSADLEKRLAELNQEIRNYPGPIARCDQHLPALLEERARLMAELERLANHFGVGERRIRR